MLADRIYQLWLELLVKVDVSGGEAQKIAIVRALYKEMELFCCYFFQK